MTKKEFKSVKHKELKSIKFNDPRRAFTESVCSTCKHADVPRNRKPCCSCYWLERETYYEEADTEQFITKEDYTYNKKKHRWEPPKQ